jgi:hypothetical protein
MSEVIEESIAEPGIAEAREKIASLYAAMMEEVIVRLDAALASLTEAKENLGHADNWKNAEFCYLQIRKTCEYAALALLVAHELYQDTSTTSLAKKWHAGEIFAKLIEFNSYAFPHPITVHINHNGPGQHHVEPNDLILTANELQAIYGKCGDRLHVGSLKRILDGRLAAFDFVEITQWRNQLVGTLNNHMVRLPHIGSVLLVVLKDSTDGKVHCAWGQAEGPFVIGEDTTVFDVSRIH